mgnify:CR=1 FL=1
MVETSDPFWQAEEARKERQRWLQEQLDQLTHGGW